MNCKNCKNQRCFLSGNNHEMSFECSTYVGKTNADRIRGMSDEELVEIFANNECGYCRIYDFCFAKEHAIDCEDAWLDWLKQETKDD